jgi:ABC-type sulfate transport system permease subunit
MLTDAILHVLYTLARWRFFMMPVFILGPFIAVWVNHISRQAGCLRLLVVLLAVPLGMIFGVVNLVFGRNFPPS